MQNAQKENMKKEKIRFAISGKCRCKSAFREEKANHVWSNYTPERRSNQGQIKELVHESVEETLNELLEAEADRLTQARYEHNEQ